MILLLSSNNFQLTSEPEDYDASPPSEGRPRKIYDQDRNLYRVFSDNGVKETAYHVTNFAGSYPVWPIVEFSMTPTGATKDKRMTSFIKCMLALLGELLHLTRWR